ncbi:Mg-protoporphyrin IX monomethyl ester oxidative cyclase subunit protein [Beggiatoa sp. PS]|nr:Mg-protoporphyrin IX monomethyl ester oxidative cyclase subunit protein [Beggiatoa sp. PS]
MARVLLVNPYFFSRIVQHPLNYMDTILSIEKSRIDRFLHESYVKSDYRMLGIESDFHELPAQSSSLGLLTLASVLSNDGHTVSYYQKDDYISDSNFIYLVNNSDIIGITTMNSTWLQANDIVRFSKKANSKIITVIGGPEATYTSRSPLKDNPLLDLVCRGEGEEAFIDLAREPNSIENIRSIGCFDFRDGENIVIGKLAKQVDITSLPPPRYDLINDKKLRVYLQFTRGCASACAFCAENGKERHKTLEQIAVELQELEKIRNKSVVFIADSDFYSSPTKVGDFYAAVKESKTSNYFAVQARISDITEQLESKSIDNHIVFKFLGVENLSDKVLAKVRKGFSWNTIYDKLRLLRKYYGEVPRYRMNFIQGLPGEDFNEAQANLERRNKLLEEDLVGPISDSVFAPTAKSKIYNNPKQFGLEFDKSSTSISRADLPVYSYRGEYCRSSLDVFLHYLSMKQLYNDHMINKFGLDYVRESTYEQINKTNNGTIAEEIFRW